MLNFFNIYKIAQPGNTRPKWATFQLLFVHIFWTEEDTRASLSAISMTAKSQAITLDGTVQTRQNKLQNVIVKHRRERDTDKVLFSNQQMYPVTN